MPNYKDAFPSKYLSAADIGKARPTVTIANVSVQRIGDDRKLVVEFRGKDKAMVLNKTNANAIADIAGSEDIDDWVGKKITLFVTKVDYAGKRVPALRVDEPASVGSGAAPHPDDDDDENGEDSEVPF